MGILTEEETVVAGRIDAYALERSRLLTERALLLDEPSINVLRVGVCEYAYRQYEPFADDFQAGDARALRSLIDLLWLALTTGTDWPSPLAIKQALDLADFDAEDWDDDRAANAASGICTIDACLQPYGATESPVDLLRAGMDSLFLHASSVLIDEFTLLGQPLTNLEIRLLSGGVKVPIDEQIGSLLGVIEELKASNLQVAIAVHHLFQDGRLSSDA